MSDAFETSDGEFKIEGYQRDKVYSRATNKYGVGAQAKINFPGSILSAMQQVVQNPASSYKTQADFVRDSVVHNLMYQMDNGILEDPAAIRMALAEEESRQIELWQSLIKQRTDQMHTSNGSYADWVLAEIRNDLVAVPDRFDWAVRELERLLGGRA